VGRIQVAAPAPWLWLIATARRGWRQEAVLREDVLSEEMEFEVAVTQRVDSLAE
jgi:hypothetical protein